MKISVIIATYNRCEDILLTISEFKKQDYTDKEIIVVDNASEDNTVEEIKKYHPDITLIELTENISVSAQNKGVEIAKGEIIWRTDSDSYPAEYDTFRKVADIFTRHTNIHIIATEEVYPKLNFLLRDFYPFEVDKNNIPDEGFPYYNFTGAGSAIRKDVFESIGGFWGFGYEELDFSTRAILEGFNIRYYPNLVTYHLSSENDRNRSARWIIMQKQVLRYQWKYMPFPLVLYNSIIILISQLILAVGSKVKFSYIFKGYVEAFKQIIYTYKNERNVIPKNKLYDVTMNVSLFKAEYLMLKNLIKTRLNKHK